MNPDEDIHIVDRNNFNFALLSATLNYKNYTTKQIYETFGLAYGQTTGISNVGLKIDILKVKVKDRKKWLWTKLKYNL